MKKLATILLSATLVLSLTACGDTPSASTPTTDTSSSISVSESTNSSTSIEVNDQTSEATLGSMLFDLFKENIDNGKSLEDTANAMAANYTEVGLSAENRQPGYFAGFSADVKDFSNCYSVCPFISTIPFVCYIFDLGTTDETALNAYLDTLNNMADPRWNICTEAEETIGVVYKGYVFFGMFPGNDF